jgi:regulator of ribonuclease activity A
MIYNTADISDSDPLGTRMCELDLRNYGKRRAFFGQCVTLKVHEDHRPGVELFKTPGEGRVLIIDGGGLTRVALLGATMSAKAVPNGWAGAIVNGALRDSEDLGSIDLGVKAICTTVRKSAAPAEHQFNVPVHFGYVTFNPGDWVYADADGVVVRSTPYVPPSEPFVPHEYR